MQNQDQSIDGAHERLVILGSGPAGYTAAIYAARASLSPLVISGMQTGGQLTITTDVENYPGFAEVVQGPWLMEQMKAQAVHVGTRMLVDLVASVDLSRRPFVLSLESGGTITCDALIIATGAQARWLGLASEERFRGFGVSACATCDGFFYRGRNVLVVGGGNTAVEEALYLSHIASKVTLIHRRDTLRAERILQDRLRERENVDFLWNHAVEEVLGTGRMPPSATGARLRNLETGEIFERGFDGMFVAIGHSPAVEPFRGQLRLKGNDCIWTEAGTPRTSISGVFAAGDVTDDVYRQAVTAAGQGCMAALDAERFLQQLPVAQAA